MLARKILNQRHFGFGDFISINSGDAYAFLVHVEHNLDRFRLLFMKDVLQNLHNELFSSVIVVMQENLIKGRALDLFLGLGN